MNAKYEVKGIKYGSGGEHIGECLVQVVLPYPERLYVPSCTPDIGPVRHSERCFCCLLHYSFRYSFQGILHRCSKTRIVDRRKRSSYEPSDFADTLYDGFLIICQEIPVLPVPGGKEKL